ncbi:unnamed protein product [Candidula unifasciata]|uniref:Uncharacterized protein n=1 Tax=Candidula unifasciata TaxID=100452 RepID=A0A8S3YTH4_9EUPU|nr:unnamed protein product [Candidula unifasciata]
MSTTVTVAKLRKVAVSCLQHSLKNLYNVHTKIVCTKQPFKSDSELPTFVITSISDICVKVEERLGFIFEKAENLHFKVFFELANNIIHSTSGSGVMNNLKEVYEKCWALVTEWGAEDALFVGVIPKHQKTSYFTVDIDDENHKCYITWDKETLGSDFIGAVSRMLRQVRDERRQPTYSEYLAQHVGYLNIHNGQWGRHERIRHLGTPGLRPHTQTYMSLTDPGEGHVMGTTRFPEWMDGAIVHVEYLERPNHLDRTHIESYRVPSVLDFSRVRMHVGSTAPTTYFLGRAVKDSGNFEEDFLKIVHITAASASSAFFMGAAECKIAMEGLSTSQTMRYMHALRAQVQRSRKQFLSAAWNLNQELLHDFEMEKPHILNKRINIALHAVMITSLGGFDKVTWDGASNTYPSKCIMYQLTFQEALTIVHEAHLKGLVTYFSYAVLAGVDGIGIGGAQVLRFMDSETGMHGPYTEQNIPTILKYRDEAASSVRGRGVELLVRLDIMFYEGSISRHQEYLRQKLFQALLNTDEEAISELIEQLSDVSNLPREGNTPYLHRAKRIVENDNAMLKEFCSQDECDTFVKILRRQIVARDENSLMEEYDSDPWLSVRHRYRFSQCPKDSRVCFVRQTSFNISYRP